MNHKTLVEKIKKQALQGSRSIPLSHKDLNKYLTLTRGMSWVFGGMPGSGKTAIVDSVFVIDIYKKWYHSKDTVDYKPFWIYRSMERPEYLKRAKWLCYMLWKDYKILVDVPTLLNWSSARFKISDELISMCETYNDFFDELFQERMYFVSGTATPANMASVINQQMSKFGRIEKLDNNRTQYVYNNEEDTIFHVIDHIGKTKLAEHHKGNKKAAIDEAATVINDQFRDFYHGIGITIQQLNRNISSMDRFKLTDVDVRYEDFKDSSSFIEDCDVALGMLNPYKLQLEEYPDNGYKVKKFISKDGINRMRSLRIMKNSYGDDDIRMAFLFLGENGAIAKLPHYSKIKEEDYHRLVLNDYVLESKWRNE